MSEKITLSGVPETMPQTVYARAKESKTRGVRKDIKQNHGFKTELIKSFKRKSIS